MKQKKIKALLAKKLNDIEALTAAIGKNFDPENIHDFRVAIKSVRSLLRLIRSGTGSDKPRLSRKLKQLYYIAGTIRDTELEKEYLSKTQANLTGFTTILDHIIRQKKKEWKKRQTGKVVPREAKKIAKHKFNTLHATTLHNFVNTRLVALAALQESDSDDQLHELRKEVKDILLVKKLVTKNLWAAAQLPDKYTIKNLGKIADSIGRYNDERTLLAHMKATPLSKISEAEKTRIKLFIKAEAKKLKQNKQLVYKVIYRAFPERTTSAI